MIKMDAKVVFAAFVASVLSLRATELENPVEAIDVPAGESLTVRGALNPQMSVTVAGDLTLTNAMADATLPADLQENLVLWMDGSKNVTTDADGNVIEWRDVRDAAGADASACQYPRAVFVADYYDYFDSVAPTNSTFAQCGEKNFVDFRQFGSGSWLIFRDAANAETNLTVRSYFAILRPHSTAKVPVGQLLGHRTASNVYSYNGTQSRWVYTKSNAQNELLKTETRIDGRLVSSDGEAANGAVWAQDGGLVHLLTQIGPPTGTLGVDNFGNWLGYHADDKGTGKSDGKYENGNRIGGPCIGEVLLFNRAVYDGERRRIEAYLLNKWLGRPSLGRTTVVAGGSVVVTADGDSTLADLSGSGPVAKSGAGTLTVTRNSGDYEGVVNLASGALAAEQNLALPPLALKDGVALTVATGKVVVTEGAAGKVELSGSGSVTVGTLAEGVRTVKSTGVDLTVRSTGTWADAAQGEAPGVKSLSNASFETGNKANWSSKGAGGTCDVVAKTDTMYHGEEWTGPVPDGNYFLMLAGRTTYDVNGEISQSFEVDQEGVYVIRFWHGPRAGQNGVYESRFQMQIDGTNVVDFTVGADVRTVGPYVLPTTYPHPSIPNKTIPYRSRFLEYEVPTPSLGVGTHTLRIVECPVTATYTDACVGFFDNIRVLPRKFGRFVWIPDSGFDSWGTFGRTLGKDTTVNGGEVYQIEGRYSYNSTAALNTTWGFAAVNTAIASSQAGLTQDGRFWYWAGKTNEWTHLADYRKAYLLNSSMISNFVTFAEAGAYTFSARYSKTDWGTALGDHSCQVTLTGLNGEGTVNVGKLWPKTSETVQGELPFTITTPGRYVLVLENKDLPAVTGSGNSGRGTIVDDIRIQYGGSVAYTPGELARRTEAWTLGKSALAVHVVLKDPGTYRLNASLAGQAIFPNTANSVNHGIACYPHVVNVCLDGEPVGRVSIDEVETVAYCFRTPSVAAGEHVVSFETDEAASAANAASILKALAFDLLTDETPPSLALEDVKLDLRGDAKLNLDFEGSLNVRGVRKDGQSLQGEVSAATAPELVTGRGSLTVCPVGMTIIFR